MKPPKLALALTLIGLLLIALSVLWTQVLFPIEDVQSFIDKNRIVELERAMQDGREHGITTEVADEGEAKVQAAELTKLTRENQAYVARWNFLRVRFPWIIRMIGVVCAACGCVLYPLTILRQKREAAASILE